VGADAAHDGAPGESEEEGFTEEAFAAFEAEGGGDFQNEGKHHGGDGMLGHKKGEEGGREDNPEEKAPGTFSETGDENEGEALGETGADDGAREDEDAQEEKDGTVAEVGEDLLSTENVEGGEEEDGEKACDGEGE